MVLGFHPGSLAQGREVSHRTELPRQPDILTLSLHSPRLEEEPGTLLPWLGFPWEPGGREGGQLLF